MGILLALVGVVVLAVAIIALHNPRSTGSGDAADSATTSTSRSPHPTASAPRTSTSTSGTPRSTAPPSGSTPVSSPDPSSDSSSALAAAQAVPLVVLNNTTTSGLAAEAAQRFEAGGWTVTSKGNLTNNIISTCAYYDPDVTGAKHAALELQKQYPTIKRVEPKFDGLPAGPVVVVLTPGYSAG